MATFKKKKKSDQWTRLIVSKWNKITQQNSRRRSYEYQFLFVQMMPAANLQTCRNEKPWDTSPPCIANYSCSLTWRSIIIHVTGRKRTHRNGGVRIHYREISPLPPTLPPHTNLVTYVHASGRDRRCRVRVSQQITKGRQAGGDRWILPLSIHARGARWIVLEAGREQGVKKKKKKEATKRRRGGGRNERKGKEWET